jgi:hypothetical protein
LATPLISREVRAALKDFDPQKHSTTTQRILFRKVSKAYNEKDWQLGNALRENQKLKNQLKATRPTKKRKVETSPNSRFVTIRAIRRAQIEAGAIEAKSADEEGSKNTIEEEDCIVVGGSSSSDNDKVEG